ncbi:MAG: phage antirepressor, partial [Clostridia bacterium]|nr:phage antirepressor [Clostridia bacterium]
MNNLEVFKNKDFGEIRTVTIDGEPYFVGKDVAEILGYSRPDHAINQHV